MERLPRSFFARDTITVARELIGMKIVRKIGPYRVAGIITETEAYGHDDDPASHAFGGMRNRNRPMFGPVGHAYVYFIYGNHFCFNVVARDSGIQAGAVLIRAIKPTEGIELIKQHRQKDDLRILTNGPGKLTQALQIFKEHNGIDCITSDELWLETGQQLVSAATSRIGISSAQDKRWRFVAKIAPSAVQVLNHI